MANVILLIGSDEDPHIVEVEKHIKALDNQARVKLFNPLCGSHCIQIAFGNHAQASSSCTIVVDDERISADSIKSVWYRWNSMFLTEVKDL